MRLRFHLDPETGLPHIYNHDVTEDLTGRNASRIALGATGAGRHLQVIYVPDPDPDSVFVVTAYDLVGKPLAAYRRRRRKARRRRK